MPARPHAAAHLTPASSLQKCGAHCGPHQLDLPEVDWGFCAELASGWAREPASVPVLHLRHTELARKELREVVKLATRSA